MKRITLILFLLICFFSFSTIILAGQGCCSHHGGQSHCRNGHYICNDGWQSSCTCNSTYTYENSYNNTNKNSGLSAGSVTIKDWLLFGLIGIIFFVISCLKEIIFEGFKKLTESKYYCNNCGKKISKDDRMCRWCGRKFKE